MKKILFFSFWTGCISLITVISAMACAPGQFCGGQASSSDGSSILVSPGGSYTLSCNYGYAGNGIYPVPGSGTCVYSGFSGTAAQFNCTAGNLVGTFTNSCRLATPSSYPHRTDIIGSITVVPSAMVISNLQLDNNWKWEHDAGTIGTAEETSQIVANPALDGKSREFSMNYTDYGGERNSVDFGIDTVSTHFVYDAWVYIAPPNNILNLEMDINQVLPNGKTVIYASQCSNVDKHWDYTLNFSGKDKWVTSNVPCDPQTLQTNTWHHFQIASQRDSAGNVTFDSVSVDGVTSSFNGASGNSAFDLGWAVGHLVLNFQIDGKATSGSNTVYVDKLSVSRW